MFYFSIVHLRMCDSFGRKIDCIHGEFSNTYCCYHTTLIYSISFVCFHSKTKWWTGSSIIINNNTLLNSLANLWTMNDR